MSTSTNNSSLATAGEQQLNIELSNWEYVVKIHICRSCAYILISLLSLFGFAAETGAQDSLFSQPGGSPKFRAKAEITHRAEVADGYTYTVLYSFCSASDCTDGRKPDAGLIQDAGSNLYSSTEQGGANGGGTVFKLDKAGHETVLYSFCSAPQCTDG